MLNTAICHLLVSLHFRISKPLTIVMNDYYLLELISNVLIYEEELSEVIGDATAGVADNESFYTQLLAAF
jgi:hypothetical protein